MKCETLTQTTGHNTDAKSWTVICASGSDKLKWSEYSQKETAVEENSQVRETTTQFPT
jgi:hypothetical protein